MEGSSADALPVFVYPTLLEIVQNAPHTHKRIITIYNPYEFAIRYKVTCTAPQKYSVIEPQGCLKARRRVDIVIRHEFALLRENVGLDRFRVEVQRLGEISPTSYKVINVHVRPTPSMVEAPEEIFHPATRTHKFDSRRAPVAAEIQAAPAENQDTTALLVIALIVVTICSVVLSLPLQEQSDETILPSCLHATVHLKLGAAFVLGFVTNLIVRIFKCF